MKKKDRIKQLEAERDHARALACVYEEEVAWYREVEPLRYSKRDTLDLDLVGEMLERARQPGALLKAGQPGPDIAEFMRVARRVMDEPRDE